MNSNETDSSVHNLSLTEVEIIVNRKFSDGSNYSVTFNADPYTFHIDQKRDIIPCYGGDCQSQTLEQYSTGRPVKMIENPSNPGVTLNIVCKLLENKPSVYIIDGGANKTNDK